MSKDKNRNQRAQKVANRDQERAYAADLVRRYGVDEARRIMDEEGLDPGLVLANDFEIELTDGKKTVIVLVHVDGRSVREKWATDVAIFALMRWEEEGIRPKWRRDKTGCRTVAIRVRRHKPVNYDRNRWSARLDINDVPYTLAVDFPAKPPKNMAEELVR